MIGVGLLDEAMSPSAGNASVEGARCTPSIEVGDQAAILSSTVTGYRLTMRLKPQPSPRYGRLNQRPAWARS